MQVPSVNPCPRKQALILYHSISHGHSCCLLKVSLDICRISFIFISLADPDSSWLVVAVLSRSSLPDPTLLRQSGFRGHLLPRSSQPTDTGNSGDRRGFGVPFLRGSRLFTAPTATLGSVKDWWRCRGRRAVGRREAGDRSESRRRLSRSHAIGLSSAWLEV